MQKVTKMRNKSTKSVVILLFFLFEERCVECVEPPLKPLYVAVMRERDEQCPYGGQKP